MKKSHIHLILAVLVVFVFGGFLGAEERDRRGDLGGVFIKLTERHIGERQYMGIVVRMNSHTGLGDSGKAMQSSSIL